MESNQKTYNTPDELDPFSLIEKGLIFLKRYWKPIFIFTFLGLLLGLSSYYFSPKLYASRMLLQSRVLTNREHIEIIETWRELLRKNEHASLARITGADIGLLKKLKKIKADEIQKLYIQNNPNGFFIDVLVTDTSALAQMEEAIISGLEHSNYVKERVASKKSFFNDMISNIKGEITKLESTKAVVDSLIRNKSSNAAPLMVDISSLNGQWIGLNEKLLSFREELRFTRAVQVLQHFSISTKPESPKLFRSVVFGLVLGVFIGYLVAIFLFIGHRMKLRTKLHRVRAYEPAE